MASPRKPVPMCVVNIGYTLDLLLPTSDGMKLIELLQRSVEVRREYVGGRLDCSYTMKDQPSAEFVIVKPNQVRAQRGADGVLSIEDGRA